MEYEKLTHAQIRAMNTADLNRFLVTCSLIPDLYCPGYTSAETLSKEANLTQTAVRYKVNVSKVGARVRAEFPRSGMAKTQSGKPRRHNDIAIRQSFVVDDCVPRVQQADC